MNLTAGKTGQGLVGVAVFRRIIGRPSLYLITRRWAAIEEWSHQKWPNKQAAQHPQRRQLRSVMEPFRHQGDLKRRTLDRYTVSALTKINNFVS
jgi:hypothetical protein